MRNHTYYDRQAQKGKVMFHEWHDECHVKAQFSEIAKPVKAVVGFVFCVAVITSWVWFI